MALLFMDGFDHYATADITKKWTTTSGAPAIGASAGRRGGGAVQLAASGSEYVSKTLAASYATLIVGFAFKFSEAIGVARNIVELKDSSTVHVTLQLNADNSISVTRNGTALATTVPFTPGTDYYLELKANIHDTTGSFNLRSNGVSLVSGSNVDTRNAGNASVNTVLIGYTGNPASAIIMTVDDLYVCDTSGSAPNNDFLGDCRIDPLYPTSDGNYSQFTPSTGTDHYALVDETAPNTTDYNDGSAVGDRDSYGLSNLAALTSQTIYGVQVNAACLKDDAGAKSASTFVRSSGTNGDGASTALGTSQVYISQIYETDPNGSVAWTESSVNAMEAGVRVTA